MKNKYLICFDLDGVLISSMVIANQIFFDTVDEFLGLPTEEYRNDKHIMALSGSNRFQLLWRDEIEKRGITEDQISETKDEYRKRKLNVDLPELPCAKNVVKLMADNFKNIAAVSSNSTYVIEEILNKLNILHFFKKISGSDSVEFSKPNPEIYSRTVEYFGLDPKNALTFEDSSHGVASAKGAGMKVIAVATGLESVEDLQKTEADIVLNDLSGLTLNMVTDLLSI